MTIGERLKEERERLGFSQPAFADLAKAGRHSQINWERGDAFPNAAVLEVWAKAGLDVAYVVTGQRSQTVAPQSLLPEGDRVLLDNFHAAPTQVQAGVKTTLGAFASATGQVKSRNKREA